VTTTQGELKVLLSMIGRQGSDHGNGLKDNTTLCLMIGGPLSNCPPILNLRLCKPMILDLRIIDLSLKK